MRSIPIVRTADLLPFINEAELIEAVAQGLRDTSTGRTDAPMPGLLLSQDPPGDCHIKFARSGYLDLIVVKAATGFYRNSEMGLPVNDGLTTVFSGTTGALRCVVDDGGLLTGMRTAATGVIASRLGWDDRGKPVGIIGTGYQAQLQIGWAARHLTDRPIQLFGRSIAKARALATKLSGSGIDVAVHEELDDFAAASTTMIICTSATSPILTATHVGSGHHIVSLGADGPGKMELSANLYARASRVAVDDMAQARHRDDFAAALRLGEVDVASVVSVGTLLERPTVMRDSPDDVTLVNLCGTAACDLAAIAYLLRLPEAGIVAG